jgi:hypothetical protein
VVAKARGRLIALRRERPHDRNLRAEVEEIDRPRWVAWAHLRIDHGCHNAKSPTTGRVAVNRRVFRNCRPERPARRCRSRRRARPRRHPAGSSSRRTNAPARFVQPELPILAVLASRKGPRGHVTPLWPPEQTLFRPKRAIQGRSFSGGWRSVAPCADRSRSLRQRASASDGEEDINIRTFYLPSSALSFIGLSVTYLAGSYQ